MASRLLHLQEQSMHERTSCEKASLSHVLGEEMQELPCQGAGGDVMRLWGLPGPGMAWGPLSLGFWEQGCDCAPAQCRDIMKSLREGCLLHFPP